MSTSPADNAIIAMHLRQARAEYDAARERLCSHGVPAVNCLQHDDEPETTDEA